MFCVVFICNYSVVVTETKFFIIDLFEHGKKKLINHLLKRECRDDRLMEKEEIKNKIPKRIHKNYFSFLTYINLFLIMNTNEVCLESN